MNTQTENKEKTLAEELSEAKSEANAEANKETRKDEPRRMRLSVVISPSRSIRSGERIDLDGEITTLEHQPL
jgi:septum formation inhibitor MinC